MLAAHAVTTIHYLVRKELGTIKATASHLIYPESLQRSHALLAGERARILARLNTLYDDRLDNTITKEQYDGKARLLQAHIDEI